MKLDLYNKKFDRLTALFRLEEGDKTHGYWWCRCSCGKEKRVRIDQLMSGKTRSCGCLMREVNRELLLGNERTLRHAHARANKRTKSHRTWESMRQRCLNPNATGYEYYGGRGITICDRWLESFENFLADMGVRPDNKTLDRIDPDGNYCPENCRWANKREQANNRRNNNTLTYDGRTQTVAEWADEIGISRATLSSRVRRGWDDKKALTYRRDNGRTNRNAQTSDQTASV